MSPGETKGRFIVIEGIDGAGTTTQAKSLVSWLEAQGQPADLDREPTDEPIGRLLREILRGDYQPGGDQREAIIALLFAADRIDHVASIQARIAEGRFVVSDRYLPSSLAYQSVFCELAWVKELNRHAIPPDLTFFFDIPPAVALARVGGRDQKKERYEELTTLTRVDDAYRAWIKDADKASLRSIDGTQSVDAIAAQLQDEMKPLLLASRERISR
jgi:dTMP kinase